METIWNKTRSNPETQDFNLPSEGIPVLIKAFGEHFTAWVVFSGGAKFYVKLPLSEKSEALEPEQVEEWAYIEPQQISQPTSLDNAHELKDFQLYIDSSYENKVIVRILADAQSGMPHVTVVDGVARQTSYITDRNNLTPLPK